MSIQIVFRILIFVGIIITAIGGLGSYFSERKESEKKYRTSKNELDKIHEGTQVPPLAGGG